jgi:hypothetical protein
MPYCPKCRDEFQEWVKTCPDCRVSLVADLPASPKPAKVRKESLVHIADAPNGTVAEMWAGLLKANHIHCLVKGGNFRAEMNAHSPFLPSGIYVVASEAQRAREILDGLPESERPS